MITIVCFTVYQYKTYKIREKINKIGLYQLRKKIENKSYDQIEKKV